MDRQPPLTVSPRQLRLLPRRPPPSPHGSYAPPPRARAPPVTRKQPRVPNRLSMSIAAESLAWVESSRRLSLDLMALARRSGEDVVVAGAQYGSAGAAAVGDGTRVPLFERGRFYEAYAVRRNERLRMRKGKIMSAAAEERVAGDPGVAVELARRRNSRKAAEAAKRSVQAPELPSSGRSRILRSPVGAARSSKEMKSTPCFAAAAAAAECCAGCGKRVGTNRSLRRL